MDTYHSSALRCTLYTHKQHTQSHRDFDKTKRLAKRGLLLSYTAAVGCALLQCITSYTLHCSGCGAAAFEIQLPRSCVGPSFLFRMIRRQIMAGNKTTETYTRLVARLNPHVRCTATYTDSLPACPAAASCFCCCGCFVVVAGAYEI